VRIDNNLNFKVSALIKDPGGNSTLKFDYVIPFNYSDEGVKRNMNEWTNSSWDVYLQMAPGANIQQLNKNINTVKKLHSPEDKTNAYFAFPMNKWRLQSEFKDGKNTGGMIEYVRLFSIIAIIILLIACVNFMNLSTARSEKRAREVGIRKAVGSQRSSLIFQFLIESFVITFAAFIVSLLFVQLTLPAFNTLTQADISIPYNNIFFWYANARHNLLYLCEDGIITATGTPAHFLISCKILCS